MSWFHDGKRVLIVTGKATLKWRLSVKTSECSWVTEEVIQQWCTIFVRNKFLQCECLCVCLCRCICVYVNFFNFEEFINNCTQQKLGKCFVFLFLTSGIFLHFFKILDNFLLIWNFGWKWGLYLSYRSDPFGEELIPVRSPDLLECLPDDDVIDDEKA